MAKRKAIEVLNLPDGWGNLQVRHGVVNGLIKTPHVQVTAWNLMKDMSGGGHPYANGDAHDTDAALRILVATIESGKHYGGSGQ